MMMLLPFFFFFFFILFDYNKSNVKVLFVPFWNFSLFFLSLFLLRLRSIRRYAGFFNIRFTINFQPKCIVNKQELLDKGWKQ